MQFDPGMEYRPDWGVKGQHHMGAIPTRGAQYGPQRGGMALPPPGAPLPPPGALPPPGRKPPQVPTNAANGPRPQLQQQGQGQPQPGQPVGGQPQPGAGGGGPKDEKS